MARSRSRRASSSRAMVRVVRPQVVRVPALSRRGRLMGYGRRVGQAARNAAREEKHTLVAVGAAAAFGLAEGAGVMAVLPSIEAIGHAGTYGLVAYGIARWNKSQFWRNVATGLLCVAAHELTQNAITEHENGEKSGVKGEF